MTLEHSCEISFNGTPSSGKFRLLVVLVVLAPGCRLFFLLNRGPEHFFWRVHGTPDSPAGLTVSQAWLAVARLDLRQARPSVDDVQPADPAVISLLFPFPIQVC